jgi:hypothetical protein
LKALVLALEELHRALVLLGCGSARKVPRFAGVVHLVFLRWQRDTA